MYTKLFAWEGAPAIVPRDLEGYFVSQEFPTFDIDPEVALPAYVEVLCSWPPLWERLRTGETGMGGRRKRVHPDRLLQVRIPLPRLIEQRRIVDLFEVTAEVQKRAIETERHARRVLDAMLDDWVAGQMSNTIRLGDIAAMGSGPSWKASDETASPRESAVRVIGC